MTDNIVPLTRAPSVPEAKKIIQTLVEDGRVKWRGHAKRRLKQREVTVEQVLQCLKCGAITEGPFFAHTNGGGYETRIEGSASGDWLRVVVCLRLDQNLAVISVIN